MTVEEAKTEKETPVVIDGKENVESKIIEKPKYKLPNSLKKHQRDFATLSRQNLSEAVRRFNNTEFGAGKEYWAGRVDRLGEWHSRFNN